MDPKAFWGINDPPAILRDPLVPPSQPAAAKVKSPPGPKTKLAGVIVQVVLGISPDLCRIIESVRLLKDFPAAPI